MTVTARFRYERGEQPLEGYTVEHGLGVGGFGEVYFAVSDSGREVALKAVQHYQEIELRGIRHCMNLKSPHLVTIFDVRHNRKGDPFVIMEYVNGPSLRGLLDASPDGLGATKAAFFLREIAKGLTYLHDAGVVHRDLKPHNVFYEDGYVKIGDYSLCKLITATQHSGHTMTVGSVHYMAPEISEGNYDASVDIYALGVMLYEMLTGTPPFTGGSIGEILMKHLSREPDLSHVQEPFRSVIGRAMAKNPADRYASPTEMVEDVFGSDHIQNSVVGFNPQELTIVAQQVVHRAENLPFANESSSPVGFESGDASAWKRSPAAPQPVPPHAIATPSGLAVTQDTGKPTNTIVDRNAAPMLWYKPDEGPALAQDRMPVALRYGLGFLVACAISAVTGTEDSMGYSLAVIGVAVIWLVLLRETFLKRVSIHSKFVPRVLVATACLIAVPISINALDIPSKAAFAGIVPLAIVGLHPLMHARRETRIHFPMVFVVAFGALLTGAMMLERNLTPVAIATGTLMALQITSPMRRVV